MLNEQWYQVTLLLSLCNIHSQQGDHMRLKLILNSRSTDQSPCQRSVDLPYHARPELKQKSVPSQFGVRYAQFVPQCSQVGLEDDLQTGPPIQQIGSSYSSSWKWLHNAQMNCGQTQQSHEPQGDQKKSTLYLPTAKSGAESLSVTPKKHSSGF